MGPAIGESSRGRHDASQAGSFVDDDARGYGLEASDMQGLRAEKRQARNVEVKGILS